MEPIVSQPSELLKKLIAAVLHSIASGRKVQHIEVNADLTYGGWLETAAVEKAAWVGQGDHHMNTKISDA